MWTRLVASGSRAPLLRPYQREAAQWLLAALKRMLFLDPGLGKTCVAIRAAAEAGFLRVLVICPAVARLVWQRELARWWPETVAPPPFLVIEPGVPVTRLPQAGWVVIAYSNLSTRKDPWVAQLRQEDWDLIIIDECQYLKGRSARTVTAYGRAFDSAAPALTSRAKHVWLLSGTPAPNHVGELYPHLRALFPEALPAGCTNEYAFEARYCYVQDTQWGRRVAGSNRARLPELRERLKPHMLRWRRDDVLKDLPPLSFFDTPISVAKSLDLSFGLTGDIFDDDSLIRQLQAKETQMATARRGLGLAKAPAAAAFCDELLDEMPIGERKLVLFAYHRDVIRYLADALPDRQPVVVDGSTLPAARARAIDAFQGDPHTQVFIGQLVAAGTAITLTAAATEVFVECSWSPSENYQAALRIHRLGQHRACFCHFLYAPGSLDQAIMRTFRRKASELAQLLETPEQESAHHAKIRGDRDDQHRLSGRGDPVFV